MLNLLRGAGNFTKFVLHAGNMKCNTQNEEHACICDT
jgi:hypothetical protein